MPDTPEDFLAELKDVCAQIAQGNYDRIDSLFDMTAREDASSALQELAESFGSMVVQIEAREYRLGQTLDELKETNRQLEEAQRKLAAENVTLRSEVQKLKIEIDQGRKEQEVSEIVETDYFQTLRSKARELRDRHRS